MEYIKESILNSKEQYICHQVSCRGYVSTLDTQFYSKWPTTHKAYLDFYYNALKLTVEDEYVDAALLGKIDIIPINKDQHVINLFSQSGKADFYFTSAFTKCLTKIKENVPIHSSIAFSFDNLFIQKDKETMIELISSILQDDYKIYIYEEVKE